MLRYNKIFSQINIKYPLHPPPPDLVLLLTRAGVGVRLLLHAAGELLLLLLIDTVDSIVHSRHQVTSLTSAQVLQHRVQTPVPLRLSEW